MYLWVGQISDPSPLLELLDNHLLVRCLSSGEAERDLEERVEGIIIDHPHFVRLCQVREAVIEQPHEGEGILYSVFWFFACLLKVHFELLAVLFTPFIAWE